MLLLNFALLLPMHPPQNQQGCWCHVVKKANGWCNECAVGYIAGTRIESYTFVEALDTHGHSPIFSKLPCQSCREAAEKEGICEKCGWGYRKDKRFASRLTYYLSFATPHELESVACQTCRRHAARSGWCATCKTGWVAHFAFRDRKRFEEATHEQTRMLRALENLPRCEQCAAAQYFGTMCARCRIHYKDGKAAPAQPNGSGKKE